MGVFFGMKVDCKIPAKTSYQFKKKKKEAFFSAVTALNLLMHLLQHSREAFAGADLKIIYESFQEVLTFIIK